MSGQFGDYQGEKAMPDLIEDLLAFLYATGYGRKPGKSAGEEVCPECGAVMEEDDAGELRCPECG